MAQFTYQEYENTTSASSGHGAPQIGFFKLGPNEEALVRFNIHSVSDLQFAQIHKPYFGKKFDGVANGYAGISCLNGVGDFSAAKCPFCAAAATGDQTVAKAEKKVYVQMKVSYKDPSSGSWAQPVSAVWERPAGFARELATKIQNYGDLTQVMFKITRVGGGKETKYSLDYAVPTIFKPEMISTDFSEFATFKLNAGVLYEKSYDEMARFVRTRSFSSEDTNNTTISDNTQVVTGNNTQANSSVNYTVPPVAEALHATTTYTPTPTVQDVPWNLPGQAQQVTESPVAPKRDFSGFSF